MTTADGTERQDQPGWSRALDAAITGGIAAFAVWTVLYEVALALDWPATPIVLVWVVLALPGSVAVARRTYRRSRVDDRVVSPAARVTVPVAPAPPTLRRRFLLALVLVVVTSATLLTIGMSWVFWVGWGLVLLTLVAAAPWGRLRRRSWTDVAADDAMTPARYTDVGMLAVSALVTVLSLFMFRISADDAYYVNLSTWVAQRGRFPLRDTMFSDQVFRTSYGGGLPIASIEGLIGALARLVGVQAPTMAYLVVAPVLGFVSIWVLGSLARSWSPRHTSAVFGWSVAFVLLGGGGAFRSFSIFQIYQGKSAAIAIVIPLVWVFATRLVRSGHRYWVFMIGLTGVAFTGLTSTAVILAPVLAAALVVAAAVLRHRRLLAAAATLLIAPVLGGLAVAVFSGAVGGPLPMAPAPWRAIHLAFGPRPTMLVVLTVIAMVIGPLLLHDRRSRTLAWSATVVSFGLLAPGVFVLGNAVTRAGPVEWRMLLAPPVPTLIGVCATTALLRAVRAWTARSDLTVPAASTVVGLFLLTGIVFVGTPPWAEYLHASAPPAWRTDLPALANVEALLARQPPSGRPVLMPEDEMAVLSLATVRWHGVAPRLLYALSLDEPKSLGDARFVLVSLVSVRRHALPLPPARPHAVRAALRLLDVGTVCLPPTDRTGQRIVRTSGFGRFVDVGTLRCAFR